MNANTNMARSVARLAAVQALYQMEVSGATTADVVADFTAGKLPRETEASYTDSEGDLDLFKLLVEKSVDRQATYDRAIARHLSKGWRLERIDAVARAKDYDSGVSLAGYKGSAVEAYAADADAFTTWRDPLWPTVFGILADVQSGAIPQPTIPELIAMLPASPWPS